VSICPKCSSAAKPLNEPRPGDLPQEAYRCTLCGYEFVVNYGAAINWPAADYVKQAAARDEEKHALHVRFMEKQLATMDAEAAYRAVLQEHHVRQTAALEGMLALLRQVQEDHAREREEDRNRSCVVMD
jgi:hypothetical protein